MVVVAVVTVTASNVRVMTTLLMISITKNQSRTHYFIVVMGNLKVTQQL
jgi:hypothetical protein